MHSEFQHSDGFDATREFADYVSSRYGNSQLEVDDEAEAWLSRVKDQLLRSVDVLEETVRGCQDGLASPREKAGEDPGTSAFSDIPVGARQEEGGSDDGVVKGFLHTFSLIINLALENPASLARHYAAFASEALDVLSLQSDLAPDPTDRRFRDPLWKESPLLRSVLQLYIAWSNNMQAWLAEQILSEGDRRRVDFIFEQIIAAFSPANIPMNPVALKRAKNTAGQSTVTGIREWVDDLVNNRGMPKQIRPDAYEVGRDLAITEGAVIFRNEQLELLQYRPLTEEVRRIPVLLVPPQINKYYIFDLKPKNSLIRHLVNGGMQMFTISWRNPRVEHADWGLDVYVKAILEAMDVVREVTKSRKVNLVSACAGGLTTVSLLGYLAELGESRVNSHSLLVTSLFAKQGSKLELFATPAMMDKVLDHTRKKRLMDGGDMAKYFAWMRPQDLIWNYWTNNYLMGKTPPSLDVLFWDNDSTRLPAALHNDFFKIYNEDVYRRRDSLNVLGKSIDFRKVKVNSYLVGASEDYIMPWRGCYLAAEVFSGKHQFVLSSAGHVQSIIRPPDIANIYYYTNTRIHDTPDLWLETAEKQQGSWWQHWLAWLSACSGSEKRAPKRLGSKQNVIICPAPGSYVHEK